MTLQDLKDHILDTYSVEPDHPFKMDDVVVCFGTRITANGSP